MAFCGGQYFTDDVVVCYGQYFTTDTQYSGCDGQCCATHRKYIVVVVGSISEVMKWFVVIYGYNDRIFWFVVDVVVCDNQCLYMTE